MREGGPVLISTITCPACGARSTETMPTDACWFFYECSSCDSIIRPLPGKCCVFCSYGTHPCPPMQVDGVCAKPAEGVSNA